MFLALLVLAVSFAACFRLPVAWADNEQASIEAAESSIRQAFVIVLEAEEAGGNVTQLLAELNVAGALLAEAENAYGIGNLNEVAAKTGNASLITQRVMSEGLNLRDAILAESQNAFWLTLAFSATGAIVLTLALVL